MVSRHPLTVRIDLVSLDADGRRWTTATGRHQATTTERDASMATEPVD